MSWEGKGSDAMKPAEDGKDIEKGNVNSGKLDGVGCSDLENRGEDERGNEKDGEEWSQDDCHLSVRYIV